MKNCLSNVAEIARNHDIFGPIDERIWDRVQAVSDFYTAFRGNIGKLRINVENGGAFTFPSSRKPRSPARIAVHSHPGACCRDGEDACRCRVRHLSCRSERKAFALSGFTLRQIRLF
jgi:hypothetical protein